MVMDALFGRSCRQITDIIILFEKLPLKTIYRFTTALRLGFMGVVMVSQGYGSQIEEMD